MSTDLQSSSKAYDLTRVSAGMGQVDLIVGLRQYNKPSIQVSVPAIQAMFETDNFSYIQRDLDLLDETMDRLKFDLARFVITKGNGMELSY